MMVVDIHIYIHDNHWPSRAAFSSIDIDLSSSLRPDNPPRPGKFTMPACSASEVCSLRLSCSPGQGLSLFMSHKIPIFTPKPAHFEQVSRKHASALQLLTTHPLLSF